MARPSLPAQSTPTRTRLLDAAETEFGNAGFSGAKLAEIAARAGIRRPSLLYHFASKDLLYAAVVERTMSDIGDALMATIQMGGSVRERFMAPVNRFGRFLEDRPSAAKILLREVLDDHGPGRDIVIQRGVPILTLVERFLLAEAKDVIPPGYPVRALLMQSVSNLLLWSAAGPLRKPLWGGYHNAPELVGALWNLKHTFGEGEA